MFYFHISTAPGAKQLREYYIKEAKESKIHHLKDGIHVNTSICSDEDFTKNLDSRIPAVA